MVPRNQNTQPNSLSHLDGLIVDFQKAGITLIATVASAAGEATSRRSTKENNKFKNQELRHLFGNVATRGAAPTASAMPEQSKNDYLRNLFAS